MKITNTWAIVLFGLVFSSAPVGAQEFWYVPHVDEARTPVEVELQSSELALPGFGIASTKSTIIKRLEYALDHKWLSASQDQQLCNELKAITDKEQSLRDENGKLSYQAKTELARQLTGFNDKFEELVLVREQSNPGIPGLQARQAMMVQRVNQALNDGKMTAKRAVQLKAEIREIAAEVPEKDISEDLSKQVAAGLNKINNDLDKDLRQPSMATRPLPFSR